LRKGPKVVVGDRLIANTPGAGPHVLDGDHVTCLNPAPSTASTASVTLRIIWTDEAPGRVKEAARRFAEVTSV